MSYEDRVKQIQNGLQIVELVNEIRANNKPKPTYGRSAISLPSTKDRTSAWELFHQVASDANGHEERPNKEGDDSVERGNVRGVEYDNDDTSGRGERSFKEANWDESDNIILENPLAANIHKDDSGRESANRVINNKDDVSKCDNAHRGLQSNGSTENDQVGVPSILKSSLSTDRDAQGSNNKTKHQMNPYAQEYVPKWSTNTANNIVESKKDQDTSDSCTQKNQGNLIKPMMQKKILDCDKYPGAIDNVKLTPIPKQRGSIINRIDMNIEPIESGDESEDDEDDDQVVPETGEQDVDSLEKNLTLSSSQETLFNISDYETDNERRNRWSLKPVRTLSECDSTGETKEEMAEKKSKMENPNQDLKPKEGRKLRALQSTNAGKEGQPEKEAYNTGDIKKGHRREYSLSWDGSEIQVEEWCNPTCAPIRTEPVREECTCYQCPPECSQEGCTKIRYKATDELKK
ncbi:V protein [denwin virus]|uniref:Non-structural protein V n=1 Tax=denwin virus TaxID=2940993 RepID=A0AAE9KY24_9MONO|nr:V protein [denwin virus]